MSVLIVQIISWHLRINVLAHSHSRNGRLNRLLYKKSLCYFSFALSHQLAGTAVRLHPLPSSSRRTTVMAARPSPAMSPSSSTTRPASLRHNAPPQRPTTRQVDPPTHTHTHTQTHCTQDLQCCCQTGRLTAHTHAHSLTHSHTHTHTHTHTYTRTHTQEFQCCCGTDNIHEQILGCFNIHIAYPGLFECSTLAFCVSICHCDTYPLGI